MPQRGKQSNRSPPSFHLETMEQRILFSADAAFAALELTPEFETELVRLQQSENTDHAEQDALNPSHASINDVSITELYIVDSELGQATALLADSARDAHEGARVVVLDAKSDALTQISEILAQQNELSILHLVSHSSSDSLELGGESVGTLDLLGRANEITQWRGALAHDAELRLHGYGSAETATDTKLIDTMARLTGVPVSASNSANFSQSLGSDNPTHANTTSNNSTRAAQSTVTELVFVQSDLTDSDTLINDLRQNAVKAGNALSIVMLDVSQDGFAQIDATLSQYSNLDAIHFVTHGADALIQLGDSLLSADNVNLHVANIETWGSVLSESGDILFYGCDVAATEEGRWLVQRLGAVTGADVAASDNTTGHKDLDGDWILEYRYGELNTDFPFNDAIQQDWFGALDIATDLVLHFEFEENGGATAIDSTVNGNDGSWTAAPSWSGSSAVGSYSMDFELDSGTNTFVSVSDDASLDISGDFSVAFWYNATSAQADSTQLIGQYSVGDGFFIYANSNGNLQFLVDGASGVINHQYVNGFINDGNWHHVVATRSGNDFQMYVDGVANTAATFAVGSVSSNEPLLIGGTASSDYEGKLDEVRLYTRALSNSDVAELYAYTGTAPDITTGLMLHNTFDTDASDSSGNNYDGTLTNGALINTTGGTNQIGAGKVSMDGNNDYVELSAHTSNFNNLTQGTIATWVYTDTVAGSNIIFQTSDSGDNDSRVALIRVGDEIAFYVHEGPVTELDVMTTSANLIAGSWNHVAVSVDANGNKLYVNGVQQSVNYVTGSASTSRFFDDVTFLDFMAWGVDKYNVNNFGGYFDGFLDDGRIYDRALSSADIFALYNYTGAPTPQTFTVTNTLDDGSVGSLRWALTQANLNLGADTIDFNIAGTGAHTINLLSALPDITEEVSIDATTDDSFSANGSNPAIVIDGDGSLFDGFRFTANADNSELRGFVIRELGLDGIEIQAGASGITIAGNWIGRYDTDGTLVPGEDIDGAPIRVLGDNNTIGGITAADRNVIHDFTYVGGVALDGISAINNTIAGNYFGTTVDGNSAVEGTDNYAGYGVFSINGANTNTIGGATDNHRNIFGGVWEGIGFYAEDGDNNTVQNNWFGLGADGVSIIHNEVAGVRMDDADSHLITENVFVGTKWGAGIRIDGGANDSIIQGNFFGTDENGHLVAANWNAIDITGSTTGTIIGGVGAGEGNVIANSSDNAIEASTFSSGTTIRGNAIYDNAKLGIDLNVDGVTLNDAADVDTGANNLQNWAVLNSAAIADDGTFSYNLDTTSLASGTYTIDLYASADRDLGRVQGERYIGSITGVSDGNSALTGTLAGITMDVGEFVTLITTDVNGNSSEFSTYVMAMDSDKDGVSPEDIKTTATTDGGLTINSDGGNDIYLIADDSDALLGGRTALSFETEFTSLANSDYLTLLSYAAPSNQNELVLEIQGNGSATLHIAGQSVNSTIFDYLTLWDGSKHSIGFTWDGSNGSWAIYADGVVVDSNVISATLLANGQTIEGGGVLLFGQEQDSMEGTFSPTQEFFGTLFNTRLFDDVRTEAEMSASYQTNLPYDEDGLLAQWTFDNLSVDGVVTDSVNGNNLTIKHTNEVGFSRSEASLTFAVDENALNGTVVGSVYGLDPQREAEISMLLAANPNLHYSAETGKFYEYVDTGKDWATALADAQASTLNGVNGNLIAINSATENQIVVDILNTHGGPQAWLAASDEDVEGEWRWYDAGSAAESFWKGDGGGYNVDGAYENWGTSNPNDSSGQDYAKLFASSGEWDDVDGTSLQKTIIEYDADAVLDATQALTYTITAQTIAGAFDVEPSTGNIVVLDGTKLDADTQPVHTITVEISDVNSNTVNKDFTISLNDYIEDNNAPTNLSSGIELNTDDGNGTYLQATDGGAVLGGLTQLTFETTFLASEIRSDNILIDYGTSATDDAFQVTIKDYGDMFVHINNSAGSFTENNYSQLLLDGQPHHFAVSWDHTNGSITIYIDGKLVESKTGFFDGETIDGGVGDGTLIFGQNQNSIANSFDPDDGLNGIIYDIRLWNEVRSAAEIAFNHQHKFDSGSLPSGLIANWQMDSLNGSNQVIDVVGNNNLNSRHVAAVPLDVYSNVLGGVSTYGSMIVLDASVAPSGYSSQVNSAFLSSLGYTDDYTVSFTLDEVDAYNFMIGLALSDSGPNYTSIDHAMYFTSGGSVFSYQSGISGPGSGASPVAGDEFSFYVNGTTIEYKHNGTTFHTETITANSDWFLDTSFTNEANVSLSNVRVFDGAIENTNFIYSDTPVIDLHISENTTNGEQVGFIKPTDPDAPQDIVSDGQFLKGDTGLWADYLQGQTIGDWTVESGHVSHTSQYISSTGGVGLELQRVDGDFPSSITQTLTTEVGRQYQVVFGMTGNFSGGDAVKYLMASAGGQSMDFQVEQTASLGTVYEARSFTFTADSASTVLRFASGADDGWGAVITDIQVIEIPQAISSILNDDSTLSYDAATNKFYKIVTSGATFENAKINAAATEIAGVGGQLATIRSQYEDSVVFDLIKDTAPSYFYLGATDATTDGNWNWIDDGVEADRFWTSGTGPETDAYVEPNFHLTGGAEDALVMIRISGNWTDINNTNSLGSIVEWDASEVLSNFTFNLSDDAGGRFALDNDTGEVTVADAASIDFEMNPSHTIEVQVTDAANNSRTETLSITIDNGIEPTQIVPGAQATNENTPLVFSIANGNAISVNDTVATNNTRLQVFISTNNNGTLTLSQTTGLSILGGSNGGTFMTIHGTESDLNAAFEGMTFYPVSDFTGSVTLDMTTTLAADMTGHYTFESATVSGSTVADQSVGLLQNGTLNGNAAIVNDIDRGDVLSFDGAGDFIQIDGLMGNPADITLSAWINANSLDSLGAVAISLGTTPALYLYNDGTLVGYYESGGVHNVIQSTESLVGTGWRHVAVSIDGTNMNMTLYIDGIAVESSSTNGPIDYDNFPDTYIGRSGDGLLGFDFDGMIDDVRIHSSALSSAEIAALATGNISSGEDTVTITVDSLNEAPTFYAGDGITTNFPTTVDMVSELVRLDDGKLVSIGSSADGVTLTRFNEDGSIDTSFGTSGRATATLGGAASVQSGALQDDGKFLVVGGVSNESFIARFNADGSLDTSFDSDGLFTIDISGTSSEYLYDVVVQSNGNIVAVGHANFGVSDYRMTVVRVDSNGNLDLSFDGTGFRVLDIGPGDDRFNAVALDSSGRIVAAGTRHNGTDSDIAVVRFNSNGSLDTTLDTDGIAVFDVSTGNYDGVQAVAIDSTGRIVLGGVTNPSTSESLAMRLLNDGSLDTSFNGIGYHIISAGTPHESITDLKFQADGKIVMVGSAYTPAGINDVSVIRLNTDGTLDSTFDGDGLIRQPIGTATDDASAVVIAPDGDIIVAGRTDDATNGFHVMRFDSNGNLDTRFSLENTLDGNPSFIDNGPAVVLDSDVAVFDTELSALNLGNGNFDGASATLVRNGGVSANDVFSFNDGNGLTLSSGSVIKNTQEIATFDTTSSIGELVITFTDANGEIPTSTDVDNILRQITYSNSNNTPPASVQIDWTFDDGNVLAQGVGGNLTTTGSVTVNIVSSTDLSITAPTTVTTNEDTPYVYSGINVISVDDGVATDTPIRVSLIVGNGTLQLSSLTGITVVEGADASSAMVIEGLESDINTALNGIRFIPNLDYNGADTLKIKTAIAAGLEGHYTFNDTTADDFSAGTAHDGTFNGNASTITDADRGEVLNLDGIGDFVTIATDFDEPTEFTLSAWVNLTASDTQGAEVISLGDSRGLRLDSDDGPVGFYWDGAMWQETPAGVGNNLAGTGWRHISYTVDSVNDVQRLYIDGVLTSETFYTTDAVSVASGARIGQHGTGSTDYDFNGMIDDARIYTRALVAQEIAALAIDQTELDVNVGITIDAVNDAPSFALPGEGVFTEGDWGYGQNLHTLVLSNGSMVITPYDSDGDSVLLKLNENGTVDNTFGSGGYADNSFIGYIQSVTEQADGKILVVGDAAGDIFVARYNSNGTVDGGFGTGGIVTITTGTNDEATDVTVQSDGSIVVVGEYGDDSIIARFTSTGVLDGTFGTGGITTVNLSGAFETLSDVSVLNDGSIVAVGENHVVKLDNSGTADASFGTAGILDLGKSTLGVVLQTDGKFVVAGGDGTALFAMRFNEDGSVDTGFGTSGTATWSTIAATGYSVAQQSDGKLIVAGHDDAFPTQWVAVRFNVDGTLDNTFGTNGAWLQTTSTDYSEAYSVAVYNDGTSEKIVIGGYTTRDGFDDRTYSTVVRLNHDGSFDTSLNTNTLDGNPTYVENDPAVVLDNDVIIYDAELSNANDFGGATLTIQRNGGANADDVFSGSGNLSLVGAAAGNIDLTPAGIVGTYTNTGGTLVLTFGAGATNAQVNEVLQSIAYRNTNHLPPASVQLDWTFDDGNITAQGDGGALSVSGSTIVEITPVEGNISVSVNDPAAFGPTIQVNQSVIDSDATYLSQAVALNNDGSYVVVWGAGNDGSSGGIYSQRYDALGNPLGTETLVNTTVTNAQGYPSVAADSMGNYVVIWHGEGAGDGFGVFGQRFDANGVALGSEFLINTSTTGNQAFSSIAMDSDGDFVVVWSGEGAADSVGVFAQRYDAAGITQGGELLVNTTTIDSQTLAEVAMDSDGNFTVTWTSNNQDGGNYGAYVRSFRADGTPLTSEIQVDTDTLSNQWISQIDVNASGEFVVVWRDDGNANPIQAQLFNADGSKNGGEIIVSDLANAVDNYPTVRMSSDGSFVVAWQSSSDGSGYGILARRFDASGTAMGSSFFVNSATDGAQENPTISMNDSGQFVIAFTDLNLGTVESRVYGLVTNENGGTASVDIVLDVAPTADVTIAVSMPDTTEGTLSTNLLTFTDSNWNTPQTITITGLNDSINDGDIRHLLVLDPASSTDLNFDGLDLLDLIVTNLDNNPFVDLDENDSVAAGLDYSVEYVMNTVPVVIVDADAIISDPDSANLTSLVVTITNVLDSTDEVLAADTTGTSITAAYIGGVLTLSGSDTVENYQQVLRTVTYDNTAVAPDKTNRTITFIANDGANTNPVATTTLSIANEAPIISSDGGGATAAVSAAENQTVVTTVTSTDVDGATPVYSITGGADAALFSINSASGALTFNSAPDFETPADAGADNVYDVIVQVDDGYGATDSQAIAVTVTNVNEDPVITSNGGGATAATSAAENQMVVTTVTSTDVDGGVPSYSITGGADAALFSIDSVSGALTFNTAPDFETPADAGTDNIYDVTVQVDDGNSGTDTQAIAVTVTNVNEDPVITSASTVNAAENQTVVTTVTSTDVDGGVPSYSITGGSDAALFSIDSASGALTFNTAPDFEIPTDAGADNIYDVTVQVVDGNGGTDTQAIAVSVTDANDAPLITSAANVSAAENQTVATTVTSSDVDGGVPSYSITGGADAALFSIDSASGALTFIAAPDFETPADSGGDNIYDVTVQVADGNGGTDTQAIAVTVTNVNENPVITSNGGGATAATSAAENQTVVTTVTSTDVDGGVPSYSITGGADAVLFSIDSASGALTFITTPDFETPADVGGDNIYDVTVQVADGNGGTDTQAIAVTITNVNEDPVITSNGGGATAATSATENQTVVTTVTSTDVDGGLPSHFIVGGADAALFSINSVSGALTFNTAPDFETPSDAGADNIYDVTVQVADGNGGIDTQAIAVTVTNVNEDPVITSASAVNAAENQTVVTTVTSTDVDGGVPSYAITGGVDAAQFSIDSVSGALTFNTAPDFETPADAGTDNIYDVTVQVADGNGGSATQAIAVTITNVNEDPVITSASTINAAENQTVVTTVTSTDVDGGAPSYSITGGADAALFSIDSASGALTFNAGPDFEIPADAGGDNVYDVTVQVADGNGGTDTQVIAVTVTDINDAPLITSAANVSAAENQTVATTVTSTDVDGGTPSYSITGGVDAALFSINSASGELTFNTTPNFEVPTDVGADNIYDVTVQVVDGNGGSATQAIAVTVTNVNEDPVITSASAVDASENQTLVTTVTSIDVDGDAPSYLITGGTDAALFSIDSASGALTFNSAPDFELPGDVGTDNIYDVTVQVADGNGGTVTQAIAVTVTNVNEDPVITSNGGGATAATSAAENQTVVTTVTSTDVDGGVPSYSITGGAEAGLFSIDSVSGALTFNTAPDFELPTDVDADNIYDVIVQVADGNGGAATQAIAITVTDANDDPVITSTANVSALENQTVVTTVTSTDVDGGTPSYSINGGADAGLFSIDSVSGALTFNSARNFEMPTDVGADNIYDVTVQVADGNGGTDTQSIAVTVINVNEDPVITSVNNVGAAENQTVVTTVTSTDVDGGPPNYSITGGADAALFSIDSASGALTFNTAPDFETPADVGADNSYDVTVQAVDGNGGSGTQAISVVVSNVNEAPAIVTSSNNTTPIDVAVNENQSWVIQIPVSDVDANDIISYAVTGGEDQAAFTIDASTGDLSFISLPDFEVKERYEVEVTVMDAGGLSVSQTYVVNVQNVNEMPTAQSDTLEATVNQQLIMDPVTSLLSNDFDPEQDELTLVSFTQPENGTITVNEQGMLVYQPTRHFIGIDNFEYVIADTDGLQVSATVLLDVQALSDPILAPALPTVEGVGEISVLNPQQPVVNQQNNITEFPSTSSSVATPSAPGTAGEIDESETEEKSSSSSSVVTEELFASTESVYVNGQNDSYQQQPPPSATAPIARAIDNLLQELLDLEITDLDSRFELEILEQSLSIELRDAILALRGQVDEMSDQAEQTTVLETIAPSVVGASLTAGIVTWVLRSGLLISATIAATPLWRPLDPVPILADLDDDEQWYEENSANDADHSPPSADDNEQGSLEHG